MEITMASSWFTNSPWSFLPCDGRQLARANVAVVSASRSNSSALKPVAKGCRNCSGKGVIECPGCKGTGKNKKNGNIFERWKCFECQGFGLKSCPSCGQGGLTPEQRGER